MGGGGEEKEGKRSERRGERVKKRKRAGERERQEWGEKGDGWRKRREDAHRSQ